MATQLEPDKAAVAKSALEDSPIYSLRQIAVSRVGEQLVLSGKVGTFYYKQLAQEVVRAVVNDLHVVNQVDVDE